MRATAFILPLLLLVQAYAAADEPAGSGDDVDSLFTEKPAEPEADTQSQPDVLADILPKGISIGADFSLLAGYSPGLNYLPGDVADLSQIAYVDKPLLDMTSSLNIDVRFAREVRVFSRLSAQLPQFRAEITELFCDINLLNAVYIRAGRQNLSWGISPNFPFTNLLARVPVSQDANDDAADSIACKVTVPIGVGGLDLVAFSRTTLWDAPDQPTVDEIGGGTRFNLALQNFDFSIGGYYHKDLPLRFFYALKTTLFDWIEAYTEGLAATNLLSLPDPAAASWYFSLNAGFYVDFFSKALKLNIEYFYCGESDGLTVKGADFTLFPGHNLALNASLSLGGGVCKILFQGKFNFDQTSGYIIPALTLDLIPHITFSLAVPVMLGPESGGYFQQNTQSDKRRICAVLAVLVKAHL